MAQHVTVNVDFKAQADQLLKVLNNVQGAMKKSLAAQNLDNRYGEQLDELITKATKLQEKSSSVLNGPEATRFADEFEKVLLGVDSLSKGFTTQIGRAHV